MTRLITKQMRDSFNVSAADKINAWCNSSKFSISSVLDDLEKAKKQRILILKGTIK